jgi:hypothetical protein
MAPALWLIAGGAVILAIRAVALYRSVPVAELRGSFEFTPHECDYRVISGLAEIECPLSAIPGFMLLLLHIQEDNLFFHHRGFNWPEIRRRIGRFLRAEDKLRGGSSITQQLAKNVLNPGSVRTGPAAFVRKFREAIFTLRLERELNKEEILALYLNTARWGEGRIHGIQSAAHYYFKKEPADLDLYEALFLINMLPDAPRIDAGFFSGTESAFPFQDSFAGFRYFLYWSILRWGWRPVLDPRTLSSSEVIAALKANCQPRYSIAPDYAAAIDIFALEGVDRLALICRRLLERKRSGQNA